MQAENQGISSDFDFSEEENCASTTKTQQNYFVSGNSASSVYFKPKSKAIKRQKNFHTQKPQSAHLRLNSWSKEQQLEYFCAVIKFSIQNPYQSLSWGEWKKSRFYNYVSAHFSEVYGAEGIKTVKQCKTKDQNFKNKYYMCQQRMDLLELSEAMVRLRVQEMRILTELDRLGEEDRQSLQRYEGVLSEIQEFEQSNQIFNGYEQELKKLMAYNQKAKLQMENLITFAT